MNGPDETITLRDFFAAHAMAALITKYQYEPERAAEIAYGYAEAMLTEREVDDAEPTT